MERCSPALRNMSLGCERRSKNAARNCAPGARREECAAMEISTEVWRRVLTGE